MQELASVRMEGKLEISTEAQALFQRYVEGELSSAELDRALDQSISTASMDPYVYPGTSVLKNMVDALVTSATQNCCVDIGRS